MESDLTYRWRRGKGEPVKIQADGRTITPEEVSAAILAKLKADCGEARSDVPVQRAADHRSRLF